MIHKTLEMTAKKTLVPNVVCKGEFHKLTKQNQTWSKNNFVTYQDLIPAHARNIYSSWDFYQALNQQLYMGQATFTKVYLTWQQIQYRLLNAQLEQKDIEIIEYLFKHRIFSPALYPYWFMHHPIDKAIYVLPYQWQPAEKKVFEKNGWPMLTDNLIQINDIQKEVTYINHYQQLQALINSNQSTLVIVKDLNAFWLFNRTNLNAGIIDTQSLKNNHTINYLTSRIKQIWQHIDESSLIMTSTFSQDTQHQLISLLSDKAYNDVDQIVIKRFFKILAEYQDNNKLSLTTHLEQLCAWINIHQATIYDNPSNLMITTPKHAFPHMYDQCITLNIDDSELTKHYFRKDQRLLQLKIEQNQSFFKAKSSYHNSSGQTLNESILNVTDFARHQKCPIIYTCQSKLKVNNDHSSKLKMHLGIITHAVLADFWLIMQDQTNLKKHSEWQIQNILHDQIATHIQAIEKTTPLDHTYWAFQQTHLTRTLMGWINFEYTRPPFKVVGVEQEINLQLNNKLIKGRVDRIDHVEGLGHIIIDYKTGYVQSLQSTLEGFPDPQMLIYTKALNKPIVGIAYGLVPNQQFKGVQFINPDYTALSYVDKPDIDHILETHIALFDAILKPLPYEPRQCIRCDFQSICHHASTSK